MEQYKEFLKKCRNSISSIFVPTHCISTAEALKFILMPQAPVNQAENRVTEIHAIQKERLLRMRTIKKAYEILKAEDPETDITMK